MCSNGNQYYPAVNNCVRIQKVLFNKIGEEDRTGSAWKQGGKGREDVV
jgi:hypothetical protein